MFIVFCFGECPYKTLQSRSSEMLEEEFSKELTIVFPHWAIHEIQHETTTHNRDLDVNRHKRTECHCVVIADLKEDEPTYPFVFEKMRDPHHSPFLEDGYVYCVAKVGQSDEKLISKIREVFGEIITGESESDV